MAFLKVFSSGWNYSQDGPGNRLVYHLQGCNFKCPWCSNPEGMPLDGSLMIQNGNLVDSVCPEGAIRGHVVDMTACASCRDRVCLSHNRNTGIKWSCTLQDINEMARDILTYRPMFYDGGGVTFTGGEATLQFDSLKLLLEILSAEGVNLAIETNGSHPKFDRLIPLLDFVMIDFKHYDDQKHRTVLGCGNTVTYQNIRTVVASGKPTLVRIPLIPGFNSSDEDILEFIHRLSPLNAGNLSVELLKYHEYGKVKWEECGRPYSMTSERIRDDDWKRWQMMFSRSGMNIRNT